MKAHLLCVVSSIFMLLIASPASIPAADVKPSPAQRAAAARVGKPAVYTNTIGMKFVMIPAGKFWMGGEASPNLILLTHVRPPRWKLFKAQLALEQPRHLVEISRSFYLQTTEVTQKQWEAVMGGNPNSFRGPGGASAMPMDSVSWDMALEFIRRLNKREGTNKYRLPTEAEWEYACRAGSRTAYGFGVAKKLLEVYGWYRGNSGRRSLPVAGKRPNAWGLYDMHGNLWEWCADWFGPVYYKKSPGHDPKGPSKGKLRVLRGGSWLSPGFNLRCAYRYGVGPDRRNFCYGFRVVRDL